MDRGAWGLEVLIVLSAMKLAAPQHVTLLRGNHESSTCTQLYGFRTELVRKYGAEVCSRHLTAIVTAPMKCRLHDSPRLSGQTFTLSWQTRL